MLITAKDIAMASNHSFNKGHLTSFVTGMDAVHMCTHVNI